MMSQSEMDQIKRARRYRTVDFAGPGQIWLDGRLVSCHWADLEYPVRAVDAHQGTYRIHVLDRDKRPKLRIDGVAYYHADDPHEGW